MSYKVFDLYAERYESWYTQNPILFECEAETIRSLNLKGKGLSIGIGTGILDFQAPIDVGIEPSINMLKIALTRKINLIRAIGEYLPIKNEAFDFVLMTTTFLSVYPKKTIEEAKRVLRCRGNLAICFIPRDSSWGIEYRKKAEAGHKIYSFAHFYTLSEVKRLLKRNLMHIISIKATITYSPSEKPKIEKPTDNPSNRSFICIKAKKYC
ncbi:TPA: methyltransferase domain-containing protein [Candidatus Bathyarchaeota archaeon]|nr:methyltransferase domain-containing protein [Candidatus Bathyarchaeota archaeon]